MITVLIAEDSLTQAEQLRFMLEGNEFKVMYARNGREGFLSLEKEMPAIIISDIIMPEMDGYQFCAKVKADYKYRQIPFILLTSLSDPKDVIRALQAGADSFITKPYQEEFLVSKIKSILKNIEIRKNLPPLKELEVMFAGERYTINSDKTQVMDLLLSTYENAIEKNTELSRVNSELTSLYRELAKKNAQLEQINTEKNKFLGMAAHDLRNPLGIIRGFSEFLLEDLEKNLEANHIEYLNIIRNSSEFMLQMVNDLLDISHIESGKIQLAPEEVDLVPYLTRIIQLNRVWSNKKHININLTSKGIVGKACFDPGKVEQAVNNLLSNAIKFSKENTSVDVNVMQNPNGITIEVKDQGQGIPENELEKLFKPFSRTSVKTTAGEKSTGLGLVIARRIIEEHGGKLWVKSTVGEGSIFYIFIPQKIKDNQ